MPWCRTESEHKVVVHHATAVARSVERVGQNWYSTHPRHLAISLLGTHNVVEYCRKI